MGYRHLSSRKIHFTCVSSFNYLLRWQESLVTVELRSLNHELKIQYSSSLCPDSRFQGHGGFYVTNYETLPTEQSFHCYIRETYPRSEPDMRRNVSKCTYVCEISDFTTSETLYFCVVCACHI